MFTVKRPEKGRTHVPVPMRVRHEEGESHESALFIISDCRENNFHCIRLNHHIR